MRLIVSTPFPAGCISLAPSTTSVFLIMSWGKRRIMGFLPLLHKPVASPIIPGVYAKCSPFDSLPPPLFLLFVSPPLPFPEAVVVAFALLCQSGLSVALVSPTPNSPITLGPSREQPPVKGVLPVGLLLPA